MNWYRLRAYDKAYWVYYDVIEEELEWKVEQESLEQDGMETPEEDATIGNLKFSATETSVILNRIFPSMTAW